MSRNGLTLPCRKISKYYKFLKGKPSIPFMDQEGKKKENETFGLWIYMVPGGWKEMLVLLIGRAARIFSAGRDCPSPIRRKNYGQGRDLRSLGRVCLGRANAVHLLENHLEPQIAKEPLAGKTAGLGSFMRPLPERLQKHGEGGCGGLRATGAIELPQS